MASAHFLRLFQDTEVHSLNSLCFIQVSEYIGKFKKEIHYS